MIFKRIFPFHITFTTPIHLEKRIHISQGVTGVAVEIWGVGLRCSQNNNVAFTSLPPIIPHTTPITLQRLFVRV